MSSGVTIRPMRPDEGPALQALLEAEDLAALPVDYTVWTGLVLVAEVGGLVVGFVQCLPARPYAVVTEIVVAADVRGQGVGAALMSHLETVLRVSGVTAWWGMSQRPDVVAKAERGGATVLGQTTAFLRRLP